MKRSIAFKLMCLLSSVILFTFILLFINLYPRLKEVESNRIFNQLVEKADWVHYSLASSGYRWNSATIDPLITTWGDVLHARITLIAPDGTVIADSMVNYDNLENLENHLLRPEIAMLEKGAYAHSVRYSTTLETDMMYVATHVDNGYIRVAMPISNFRVALTNIRHTLFISLLIAFSAALIISLIAAQLIGHRLSAIAHAARDIANQTFRGPIRIRRQDEIGTLAASINDMADQIRRQHQTLAEGKRQLQTVLHTLSEGVVVTDTAGRIALTNPAFNTMFQTSTSPYTTLAETIRNPDLQTIIGQCHTTRQPTSGDIITYTHEREQYLHISAAPLLTSTGFEGVVTVCIDHTQLRQAEKSRRECVANISHELKTPLTAIHGYAETLLDGALDDASVRRDFVSHIYTQAQHLHTLVDDILRLSRLESGLSPMSLSPTDILPIIHATTDQFKNRIDDKHLTLTLDLPATAPLLRSNADALHHILSNLLENAIKYTPENGTISVALSVADSDLTLSVADTGIGMSADEQARVFERFWRSDEAKSADIPGTGLGLAIVKHLTQPLGGAISLSSIPGKGSCFSICFKTLA